jgi:putative aminopeptidase FrvX
MAIPDLLERLLSAPGPSGYENAAAAVWREAAAEFAEVTADVMGSSFARVRGRSTRPVLAIVGHIDEIGVVVTHIEDSGVLAIRGLGGFDPSMLLGHRVTLLTRDGPITGVIGRRWRSPEERRERKRVEIADLRVDIGAHDADEARSVVAVGDPAVVAAEPIELRGDRLAARALDNRLGAYVALEAARLVAEAGDAAGDVVAVASVQEELELHGARAAAFSLDPDVAIVVDVTTATDSPGGDPTEAGKVELGAGPVLTRGSTLSPLVYDLLRETAEAEGIATSIEVTTRETMTDADVVHFSRGGVATALVSLPLRYLHTPAETAQLSDVAEAAKLIAAFARRLEPEASFER